MAGCMQWIILTHLEMREDIREEFEAIHDQDVKPRFCVIESELANIEPNYRK